MSRTPVPWRTAATLIIAARIRQNIAGAAAVHAKSNIKTSETGSLNENDNIAGIPKFDYKLLMLGRSAKSTFMPSGWVFPGGVVSENDFSQRWHELFCRFIGVQASTARLDPAQLGIAPQSTEVPRPPMYTDTYTSGAVLGELGFRISAIRETFEESGILLCADKNKVQTEQSGQPDFVKIEPSILSEWRSKVHDDDSKFIDLCEALNVVPHIWSLYEWSNWLTPTNMPNKHSNRRYDTAFFLACIPHLWEHSQDNKEIKSSRVRKAEENIIFVLFCKTVHLSERIRGTTCRIVHFQNLHQNCSENSFQNREKRGTLETFE